MIVHAFSHVNDFSTSLRDTSALFNFFQDDTNSVTWEEEVQFQEPPTSAWSVGCFHE